MVTKIQRVVEELIELGEVMPSHTWYEEIVSKLRDEIPTYSWVGFYWVTGDHLILGAWDGPEATEHVRINIGEGICGQAASTGETVIVDDVNEHSNYLACFPSTKSEIVVPIFKGGEVIGELDIDGDKEGAFTSEDQRQLERLAQAIADQMKSEG
ncbi:GAF domain-containing protein [bacterium]|nr:GAF domain-containing protein [bacterium]